MEKIGILGGTFNPIHHGHLTVAEEVRCRLGLDYILLIPTGQPPHKTGAAFSEHRYLMTLLAAEGNPNLRVTRMEIDREGMSYTADTLRILKEQTDAELYFIVGADEMNQISSWRDADVLPSLCKWVAVTRPGHNIENALEIPAVDISSTELRRRISEGQTIKYWLPEAVERYITEVGFDEEFEKIHKPVKAKLSKKRYMHTLGVIETSLILAARHGINMKKAYLAALLHDYAKELSDKEKRDACKKFGIKTDAVQEENISLMHGQLSAEFAQIDFGITDADVLKAVSYHSTGCVGMDSLGQLIKIADNIEPNRKHPDVEKIKTAANKDLRQGAIMSIERDIQYNIDKGKKIHHWSPDALEYLRRLV